MKFRSDIEGLRAIAILPVMIFHAARTLVPGGFVGVDIFFVISGFLISKMILDEMQDGSFSLLSFYRRRIRRIFPALFFMLAVTLPLAIVLLTPAALDEFGKTLIATALFVSNMEFLRLTGYFGGPAEFKPLLHTWSLAVEEQFYILFPFVLLATKRWLNGRFLAVILGCCVISFAISLWFAARLPSQAFYFGPTRAFELLIGAVLALNALPPIRNRILREAAAAFGLASIALCAFLFDRTTSFPGPNALLPCLGAAMIIYSGQSGTTATAAFLSLPPMRFIGKISYSLYLWHWPLLVFAKHYSLGELTEFQALVVVLASVPVAIFSWHFIERPFRANVRQKKPLFIPAIAASGAFAALGMAIVLGDGLPQRFTPESLRLFAYGDDFNHRRPECHTAPRRVVAYAKSCLYGDGDTENIVAVWGDSFGAELSAALGEAAGRTHSVMQITSSGCPAALGFNSSTRPDCAAHNQDVYANLTRDKRVRTVVLIAAYRGYLIYWPQFQSGLAQTVADLIASGKRVVLVDPIPAFPYSVPDALGLIAARGLSPENYRVERFQYRAQNNEVFATLDAIAAKFGVLRIVSADVFCGEQYCRAYQQPNALYFNDTHLSMNGARILARAIVPLVNGTEPPAGQQPGLSASGIGNRL